MAFRSRTVKRIVQNVGFAARRPRLLARAALNVGFRLAGVSRLRALDLDLTYRCPCACVQCYSDDFHDPDRTPLSPAEIRGVVAQAIELGAIHVSLSGGEPLLRGDLLEVIAACEPRRVLVTLCTSGTGLDERRVDGLHAAGLGALVLSLDSADPVAHDANRGVPGLHARVLRAIRRSHAIGLGVVVNTVATREKLADGGLDALVALAEKLDVTLNLTVPVPLSRWADQDDAILLEGEDRRRFFAALEHPRVRTDTESTYLGAGCPAAREKISLDAYGDARPCQVLPMRFGSVRDEPLRDLWMHMLADPELGGMPPFCPAGDRDFLERNRHRFERRRGERAGG